MAERIVTGLKEIDDALKYLERQAANRIARAGLAKGARLAAKQIKQQVPASLKNIRKAIGSTVRKAKGGESKGITAAKAGAGVGTASQRAKSIQKDRGKKKGVGISAQNIHWYILGTTARQTKTGHSTGRMPAHPIVKQALSGSIAQIESAIVSGARAAYEREVAKAAKKA